jgi:hypothetical protein
VQEQCGVWQGPAEGDGGLVSDLTNDAESAAASGLSDAGNSIIDAAVNEITD